MTDDTRGAVVERMLPRSFAKHVETAFYARTSERATWEKLLVDREFLQDPSNHVALFSDHGVEHVRDIARQFVTVHDRVIGLLVPERDTAGRDFMLGYGMLVTYLHDAGMCDFSAYGRAIHPHFAAQLAWTAPFEPLVQVVMAEDRGGVASRLSALVDGGHIQAPATTVLREMLALSLAHSKTAVPVEVLNDGHALRRELIRVVGTPLTLLFHENRVLRTGAKLRRETGDRAALETKLAEATHGLETFVAGRDRRTFRNPDVDAAYSDFEAQAFAWMVSDDAEVRALMADVRDTIRILRCADAMRQRGTTLKTSAGYEVFVHQRTGQAVYAIRTADRDRLISVAQDEELSAGEANVLGCEIDQGGDLFVSLHTGAFGTQRAVHWSAAAAARVIEDIQADAVTSYERPEDLDATAPPKPAEEMRIRIEEVADRPGFSELVATALAARSPALAERIVTVPYLGPDGPERRRYLAASPLRWPEPKRRDLIERLSAFGFKRADVDLQVTFEHTRAAALAQGEVLVEAGSPPSFVYVALTAGLNVIRLGGYEPVEAAAYAPIGDTGAVRGGERNSQVVALRPLEVLIIPSSVYLDHWFQTISQDELREILDAGH